MRWKAAEAMHSTDEAVPGTVPGRRGRGKRRRERGLEMESVAVLFF